MMMMIMIMKIIIIIIINVRSDGHSYHFLVFFPNPLVILDTKGKIIITIIIIIIINRHFSTPN